MDSKTLEIHYEVKDDGTARITSVPAPEETVVIPAEVDGYKVTELAENFIPFGTKTKVREVVLPDTLTTIGSRAFNDMRYFRKLSFPESVTEIGEFGIFTCPDLTELYIPETVTSFGRYAFGYMYEHGRAYKLNYFTLLCRENSAAHQFALENKIDFKLV